MIEHLFESLPDQASRRRQPLGRAYGGRLTARKAARVVMIGSAPAIPVPDGTEDDMTRPPDGPYSETPPDEDGGTLPLGEDPETPHADEGEGLGSAEGRNDPDTETDEDPRFA
jgi:hypothetical protein